MRIVVTQKDIDTGSRFDAGQCPLAKAFTRAFKQPYAVGITGYGPVGTDNPLFHQKLPQKALQFRKDFDCYVKVKPFQFTV
jgi:hypothetical protein